MRHGSDVTVLLFITFTHTHTHAAGSRYRDGLLDGLLDLHALASDGLVQLPLERQEVHVGLRLGNQVPDLRHTTQQNRLKTARTHTHTDGHVTQATA